MTVSDQKTEDWATFPDARYYQADALSGNVRSLPRKIKGREYPGKDPLKPREDGDGYLMFNYTDDAGVRHHNVSVARMMLMAHNPGGYFRGAEACHGDGGKKDNRLANLRWDTSEANREEALAVRLQNSPPKPKPPKVCPRCQNKHRGRGRNCHECVVRLGVDCAVMRVNGATLREAADALDYPPDGLDNLAVTHGGLRFYLAGHPPSPPSRLRRVINRARGSHQNSDGA